MFVQSHIPMRRRLTIGEHLVYRHEFKVGAQLGLFTQNIVGRILGEKAVRPMLIALYKRSTVFK